MIRSLFISPSHIFIQISVEGILLKRILTLKQWAATLILLGGFCASTLLYYTHHHHDARFETFGEQFFLNEVQSNPIHFHYTIDDAASYGIDESSLTLPIYHPGDAANDIYELSQIRTELSAIDRDLLKEDNQYLYDLLDTYLSATAGTAACPYFTEPLSPSSGAPSELPVLLAEYQLGSVEDIENYLAILSQIPDYFDGLIVYEQEKAAAGLFMADVTADKTIAQCSALMDMDSLTEGTHFLTVTFKERLDDLMEQGTINQEQSLSYQAEHDRLLTTVVAPAYDKLADEITLLKGNGKNIGGLAQYDGGRDYYLALLRLRTGSYRDIAEIKRILYQDLKFNYESLIHLLQADPALKDMIQHKPMLLPETTPEKYLSYLQTVIQKDYPAIPAGKDNAQIHSVVKYVDPSLEPYSAPAFYMTPPIDNVSDNVIYINNQDTSGDLALFTTLAHEGYPGHLYQTVYSQRYWDEHETLPLQNVLYYGGFIEGWAMYVELASYDYAIQLAESAHPEAVRYYQACRLDRQIQLCLYSLLDVSIHYDGASLEDVRRIFSTLGTMTDESVQAVYQYIAEEPCNYLKYYLGYLEIMELKKQASVIWSEPEKNDTACDPETFPYQFHCFLLQNGPADYRSLAARLVSWNP